MDPVDFFRFRGDEALRRGDFGLAEMMYTSAMHRNATDLPCLMGRATALAALGGSADLHSAQDDAAMLRQLAHTWIPARAVAALVVAAAGHLEEADGDLAECAHLLEVGGQTTMRGYEACVIRSQEALVRVARKSLPGLELRTEAESAKSVGDAAEVSPLAAADEAAGPSSANASTGHAPTGASGRAAGSANPPSLLAEGKSPLSTTGSPGVLGLYAPPQLVAAPACPAVLEAVRITLSLAAPAVSAMALRVAQPVGVSPADKAVIAARALQVPAHDSGSDGAGGASSSAAAPSAAAATAAAGGFGHGSGTGAASPGSQRAAGSGSRGGQGGGEEEEKKEEEGHRRAASSGASSAAAAAAAAAARDRRAVGATPDAVFRRLENWLVCGSPGGLADPAAASMLAAAQRAPESDGGDQRARTSARASAGAETGTGAGDEDETPAEDAGEGDSEEGDSEEASSRGSPAARRSAGLPGVRPGSARADGGATGVVPPGEVPDEAVLAAPRITGGGPLLSSFPAIKMQSFGDEGYRGVVMARDVEAGEEILAVDRRCLITVEHGKATPVGQRMLMASPPLRLSAAKHCYTVVFILLDQERGGSFFQPYYDALPKSFPSMPLFWPREQLQWLKGSYILTQVADRRRNLEKDYHEICRVSPDFARFSLHRFTVMRMVVASRNFGIVVDGRKTDAMVPYGDMLNHLRPRETRWTFNRHRQCFTIHATTGLRAGDQVYDSYGRKCNSRFLLNYGFTAEDNRDGETSRSLDELWVRLAMPPPQQDAWWNRKRVLLDGGVCTRGIRLAACNSHIGTREAFSFLRFAMAEGRDVSRLPYIGRDILLGSKPIAPLSAENEAMVLRALAAACQEQLDGYERSVELDLAELASGTCLRGSNRRNALILLRGEKLTARHFIRLAEVAVPLLSASPEEIAEVVRRPVTEDSEINSYVRAVVRPLVNAAASRYYSMAY
ncbi:hypothetical protein FNF27_04671 [Cafeteria roenbergensis]|uniref:SET domain-containing protein n=1 Tax=Cafeteria roenbergensis TaxID=33653 RepID=A0A5A8E7W7_CAFRO|nr:hypothetical protein FNF27_04671 [Cafeteria roenbergensis]